LHDYISFIGFLTYYMIALRLPGTAGTVPNFPEESLCQISTGTALENTGISSKCHLKLILGGYSYGSLIASHLPAMVWILKRFADVQQGTAEAEIRLRASGLAAQWNRDAQLRQEIHRERSLRAHGDLSLPANSMSTVVGGEEYEAGSRIPSRDSRRSMSAVRRSFERKRKGLGKHPSNDRRVSLESEERLSPTPLQAPKVYYLLVSPLLPPISNLATMFTRLAASRFQEGLLSDSSTHDVTEHLHSCETLAIYGSKDLFTSRKKLRAWSEALSARPDSRFRFHEVLNAGHFWREEGVEAEMRNTIRQWLELLRELPKPDPS
jgi:pimeloyl-ACP methyl ester carboxylesterase